MKKERENKIFRKSDLILYAVIAAVIVVLFIVVIFVLPNDKPTGIRVISDEETLLNYTFGDVIVTESDRLSAVAIESGYKVTVMSKDGGYNIIIIDNKSGTVVMEESDCDGKDCSLMKITAQKDAIVCVPHRLRIECIDAVQPPVSG